MEDEYAYRTFTRGAKHYHHQINKSSRKGAPQAILTDELEDKICELGEKLQSILKATSSENSRKD